MEWKIKVAKIRLWERVKAQGGGSPGKNETSEVGGGQRIDTGGETDLQRNGKGEGVGKSRRTGHYLEKKSTQGMGKTGRP